MIQRYSKQLLSLLAFAICFCGLAGNSNADDIITVDISQTDPSAIPTIREAEIFWDERIVGYSSEVPRALRFQLSRLTISAVVAPIDGVGGVLGFAGPDATLSMQVGDVDQDGRFYTLPVLASMTFDLDDFPQMEAGGFLFDVVAHEMGHAIGIGSLWEANSLFGAPQGAALTQYLGHRINGQYALAAYRRDSPFGLAGFVPLEQRGGPGTALGHWIDGPPYFNRVFTDDFTKEFMTGFVGDLDPETGAFVVAPKFYSDTSFGSCADMGYAVANINGDLVGEVGNGTGQWPKVAGPTTDPFNANGVPNGDDGNLRFNFVTVKNVYRQTKDSGGDSEGGNVKTDPSKDPYNLRNHRWSNNKK